MALFFSHPEWLLPLATALLAVGAALAAAWWRSRARLRVLLGERMCGRPGGGVRSKTASSGSRW